MRRGRLLDLYDRYERHATVRPGVRREATPHLVRHVPSDGSPAFIVWSDLGRLPSREIDARIADERERFRRLGLEVEWKHYLHDLPRDLVERLAAAGFEPGEPETLMALELEGPRVDAPPPPRGVAVRRVGAGETDAVAAVYRRVWPERADEIAARLERELRETPELVDVLVAEADGRPASAAWSSFTPGSPFAGLWGGATVPDARGRGLYRALVAARAAEARRRGARVATVDAGPMSRPILRRLGFADLSVTTPCVARPTGR